MPERVQTTAGLDPQIEEILRKTIDAEKGGTQYGPVTFEGLVTLKQLSNLIIDLVLKKATPAVRLIGTETNAKDWRWVEDAGVTKLQENTGTEGSPTWTTRFSVDNTGITAGEKDPAAAPPGLVFISSQTANNSATIDFTSGIDATYDEYCVSISDLVPVTDTAGLRMRVSQSGSFLSGATDYAYTVTIIFTGATLTGSGSNGASDIIVANLLGNSTGESFGGEVKFFAPAGTARYKQFFWWTTYLEATPRIQSIIGAGQFKLNTSAIDGVRFFMSTGNISTGTFTLYGKRKS